MLTRVSKQTACGLFFFYFTYQVKRLQTTRNQRLLKILCLSPVLLYAAGLSLPVYAATSASDMAVTANVNAFCTLSAANLDFGIYDPILDNATQDLTVSAKISTTCTLGITAFVTLSNGLHSTTTLVRRGRMLFTTDYRHMSKVGSDSNLMYELYTNADHTTVWNQSWFLNVVGSGTSEDLVVYGKVFKSQIDASAGDYTDTVTIGVYY